MGRLRMLLVSVALILGTWLCLPVSAQSIWVFTRGMFGDGSAAAPSIAFTSQSASGFYFASGNDVRYSGNGTDLLRLAGGNAILTSAATLGFGSSGVTASDTIIGRGAAGAIYFANASGATGVRMQFNGLPTVGTCGTSPSVTAGSLDTIGEVNVGTGGTATACSVTFATTWSSAPFCSANVVTATPANARAMGVTTTTSVLTFTAATAWAASDKVRWVCIGPK